jgi:hypothetical protein
MGSGACAATWGGEGVADGAAGTVAAVNSATAAAEWSLPNNPVLVPTTIIENAVTMVSARAMASATRRCIMAPS